MTAPGTKSRVKAANLQGEEKKIDAKKLETGERFEHAMSAADLELVRGSVAETRALLSAAWDKNRVDAHVAHLKQQIQRIQASSLSSDRKTQTQKQIVQSNILEIEGHLREAQVNAADSSRKDQSGEARDRRKASLDNLQKFLDILRSMNPKI